MRAPNSKAHSAEWQQPLNTVQNLPAVEKVSEMEDQRRGFLFDLTVLALFSALFLLRMLGQ